MIGTAPRLQTTQVFNRIFWVKRLKNISIIGLISMIAGVVAGYNWLGIGADFYNYQDFFNAISLKGFSAIESSRFEIGFGVLSWILLEITDSNSLTWFLLAVIAISTKFSLLRINGYGFILAALFYFTRFYPLYELVQLRAAIASGFVILALLLQNKGMYYKASIAIAIGVTMHYSALIFVPFLFTPINSKSNALIALGFILVIFINYTNLVYQITPYFPSLTMYDVIGYGSKEVNPISIANITDLLFIAFSVLIWNKLTVIMKKAVIMLAFGITILWSMSEFQVIAHRLREFLAIPVFIYVHESQKLKSSLAKIGVTAYVIACSISYTILYF
ncbi:MAG: EpsG family protein, partial [Streptococcus sp.]|nr:EpsG family protein [Streptococcus sp.]